VKGSCVVVIPIYTINLSSTEIAGFHHCLARLKGFPICFLHKNSLELSTIFDAISLSSEQVRSCFSVAIDEQWLLSARTYRSLLFQGWFYRLFEKWDYLLIFQQDAWILGAANGLVKWIDKDYTYVGAPWTCHLGPDTPDMGVGNGGFSLRHVAAMIRVCESFKVNYFPVFRWGKLAYRMPLFRRYHLFPAAQWPSIFCKRLLVFVAMSFGWHNTLHYFSRTAGTQEDHLISLFAPLVFPWMRIPSMAEAAEFSVETNPRATCSYYNVIRPFGCHAWEKHDREFWLSTYPKEFKSVISCEE